jgi:hypothetical protein
VEPQEVHRGQSAEPAAASLSAAEGGGRAGGGERNDEEAEPVLSLGCPRWYSQPSTGAWSSYAPA